MAGGIDWFRWHHGTVTDQKFPFVAHRAGATVAEVIAVWACVLEAASQNEEQRGVLSAEPDFVAMGFALGLPEGRAEAIFRAMVERKLLDQYLQVSAWPRRQPKREREGDNSTDRVRAHRERKRHETPGNASNGPETPRGEERRVDKKTPPQSPKGEVPGFDRFWSSWPQHSRKVAKDQCKAKWESKGCEALTDAIVAHVEASKRSDKWREDGGQYIPAPLVYLNQKRWEAPVDAPAAAPASTVPSRAADDTADYLREQQMTAHERQASAAAAREARERIARLKGGMLIGGNA
jgi:hypothetical protein